MRLARQRELRMLFEGHLHHFSCLLDLVYRSIGGCEKEEANVTLPREVCIILIDRRDRILFLKVSNLTGSITRLNRCEALLLSFDDFGCI